MTKFCLTDEDSEADVSVNGNVLVLGGDSVLFMRHEESKSNVSFLEDLVRGRKQRVLAARDECLLRYNSQYNNHLSSLKENSSRKTLPMMSRVLDSTILEALKNNKPSRPSTSYTYIMPDVSAISSTSSTSDYDPSTSNNTSKTTFESFQNASFETPTSSPRKETQALEELKSSVSPALTVSSDGDSNGESVDESPLIKHYKKKISIEEKISADAKKYEEHANLRNTVKRTINEKVTVTSKKFASQAEVTDTGTFFVNLLTGKYVQDCDGKKLKLEGNGIAYAMTIIVECYVKLLKNDLPLCATVSKVLHVVASGCPLFASFIVGALLTQSSFLSLCPLRHASCVDWMLLHPDSRESREKLNREKAYSRLFFSLLSTPHSTTFPVSGMWTACALAINSPPLLLATPLVLNEMIEVCGSELHRWYPTQKTRMVALLQDEVLPLLQKELDEDEKGRRLGSALLISVLRNTLDSTNMLDM